MFLQNVGIQPKYYTVQEPEDHNLYSHHRENHKSREDALNAYLTTKLLLENSNQCYPEIGKCSNIALNWGVGHGNQNSMLCRGILLLLLLLLLQRGETISV
jgi:hypothetical protein